MGYKILVVDDSETVRTELKTLLVSNGFDVVEGENGEVGFDRLKGNPDTRLIICDVNMPVVDGLTLCERIHGTPDFSHIPILMLTTESSPEMKARGKAAGVVAWITKPMNPERLIGAAKKLIQS